MVRADREDTSFSRVTFTLNHENTNSLYSSDLREFLRLTWTLTALTGIYFADSPLIVPIGICMAKKKNLICVVSTIESGLMNSGNVLESPILCDMRLRRTTRFSLGFCDASPDTGRD
jgi:hypothetical protein